jgi:predicted thioesterase
MKSGLKIGSLGELVCTVDPTMTITLGGIDQATVFSTPSMIMLMERSAREALRPFLEEGEESVGVKVQVEHVGAAVLGSTVRAPQR